ncbi:hypothetical protein H6504_04545 [Candidatus Woesearchaeota archaeon]|nr:hypothetical protein [Candidatus Woesearchaeota archaeon]
MNKKLLASSLLAGALLAPNAQAEKAPELVGSAYLEAMVEDADWQDEKPAYAEAYLGYNALGKDPKDGTLLLPVVRGKIAHEFEKDNVWGNYIKIGVGTAYVHGPFRVGAEVGYIQYADEKEWLQSEEFAELYGNVWKAWSGKQYGDDQNFPLQPVFIVDGDFDYNTISENLQGRVAGQLWLKVYENGCLEIGPYAALELKGDTKDQPWNNYADTKLGVRASCGGLTGEIEAGERHSFNDGPEGKFVSGRIGYWKNLTR